MPSPSPPHLIYINHFKAPNEEIHTRTCPKEDRFILVTAGEFFCEWQGGRLCAQVDDLLFLPAGVELTEWNRARSNTQLTLLQCQWPDAPFTAPTKKHDRIGRLQIMIERISRSIHYTSEHGRAIQDGLFHGLIAEFLILSLNENRLHEALKAFVLDRLSLPISIAEIAKDIGYSRSHFSRKYMEETGRSPMKDVMQIRMEEARDLILHTDLPVKFIAPRVGLSSAGQLSRLFPQYFGVSIRQFRRSGLPSQADRLPSP
ncbi:MAG: helix-turn-helix domain-containing protein [Planctomycetota bacterium]|jgi:AraC-like DNA-binding protein